MSIRIATLTGAAFAGAIPAVSRLRATVFREWPYLYEARLDTEQAYMAEFGTARDAVIITASDGDEIVGAATAAPLASHTSEFVPLFATHGFDPGRVFYFGESVLLAQYRGRGIGHAFFDAREAAARSATTPDGQTYSMTAFCGVVRDAQDPRRPASYAPLDPFWTKRGYRKVDGMLGSYSWKEIGSDAETSKPMQFWVRDLITG